MPASNLYDHVQQMSSHHISEVRYLGSINLTMKENPICKTPSTNPYCFIGSASSLESHWILFSFKLPLNHPPLPSRNRRFLHFVQMFACNTRQLDFGNVNLSLQHASQWLRLPQMVENSSRGSRFESISTRFWILPHVAALRSSHHFMDR